MKYYVVCVGYDSDYEIVVCDTKDDAFAMCKHSTGIAVFDKKPVFVERSCSVEE